MSWIFALFLFIQQFSFLNLVYLTKERKKNMSSLPVILRQILQVQLNVIDVSFS